MTAPWNRFRAHHGNSGKAWQSHQLCDLRGKLRRLHVIGITTETLVPPSAVNAIQTRAPTAAQALAPNRTDPGPLQLGEKGWLLILRVPSRARNAAHIHKCAASVLPERLQEHLDRQCGMPNRQHSHLQSPYVVCRTFSTCRATNLQRHQRSLRDLRRAGYITGMRFCFTHTTRTHHLIVFTRCTSPVAEIPVR